MFEERLCVYAASGTCKSLADSDETVILQYGIGHLSTDSETTEPSTTRVTLSTTSSYGSVKPLSTPATAAEVDNSDVSAVSSLRCTNWTDIEQLR